MTEAPLQLHRGSVPMLLSMPHIGTQLPEALRSRLVERALKVEDTDWHLDRLYEFAPSLGLSVLQPRYSRYVIDLNRPADNTPMYPGASNTELCPTRFFTGDALYREGCAPDEVAVSERRERYWQPYHDTLQAELQRLRAVHGYALLWDGHSIRSSIPWLFEGTLPDLNIGTASGSSCALGLAEAVMKSLASSSTCSQVLNGRFKGGYITRRYGQPQSHVHALQMEMCQHLYMDEGPVFAYDAVKALPVQGLLRSAMQAMLDWGRQHYGR